ncbi:MAG: hypothetical protein V1944_01905 [Candidatus Aenigmatarchaeota archaeon]
MENRRRQGLVERGMRLMAPAAPIIGGLACYAFGYGLGFSGSVIDQATNFVMNVPHYMASGFDSVSIGTTLEQATYVGNVVSKPLALGGALTAWKAYRSFVDGIFGRS